MADDSAKAMFACALTGACPPSNPFATMARRVFRKLMPDEQQLRGNRMLRLFGSTLFHKRLWQLNRHSVAWGVACGVFWAWIALPIQTIAAALCALIRGGNVPLAMAFTWVSNPLTWVPCFLLAYEVGVVLTGAEHVGGFRQQIETIMGAGLIDGTWMTAKFLTSNLLQLYPMYVGGVVIGAMTGGLSYAAVHFGWKWHVARRWKHRHEQRRKLNPAHKLTSGFAHLARLARHHRHSHQRRHQSVNA